MSKQLMTVADAASYTGLPTRRIYELVAKAKSESTAEIPIPFVPIEGRIYFRPASLDDWLRALETVAVSVG